MRFLKSLSQAWRTSSEAGFLAAAVTAFRALSQGFRKQPAVNFEHLLVPRESSVDPGAKPDYAQWDSVDPLPLWIAAHLWAGQAPAEAAGGDAETEAFRGVFQDLKGAVDARTLQSMDQPKGYTAWKADRETRVSREDLAGYARFAKKTYPEFLFPEERLSAPDWLEKAVAEKIEAHYQAILKQHTADRSVAAVYIMGRIATGHEIRRKLGKEVADEYVALSTQVPSTPPGNPDEEFRLYLERDIAWLKDKAAGIRKSA